MKLFRKGAITFSFIQSGESHTKSFNLECYFNLITIFSLSITLWDTLNEVGGEYGTPEAL